MESCEERIAPATLPAPTPDLPTVALQRQDPNSGNSNTSIDYVNPVVVADPRNDPGNPAAAHFFLVTTSVTTKGGVATLGTVAQYSVDGGAHWQRVNGLAAALRDPTLSATANPNVFSNSSEPSVAFGRDGSVYVVYLEHNAAKSAGVVVLQKFNFSGGGAPIALGLGGSWPGSGAITGKILYAWIGPDMASNPVVGVDNNVPFFQDGPGGATQTDTMVDQTTGAAKAVYVAWNGNAQVGAADRNTNAAKFNPHPILAVASGDGGQTFSSPIAVNTGGYLIDPNNGGAAPQIVFSPGTPGNTGGQLVFLWTGTNSNNQTAGLFMDASQPDGGNAATPAAFTQNVTGGQTGPITDAIVNPTSGQPDIPATTVFNLPVNITDANFTTLTDLSPTLTIISQHMEEYRIYLQAPDGTTIQLLDNRTGSDGKARTGNPLNPGVDATPAWPTNPTIAGGFGRMNNLSIGTTFSQYGARKISDPANNTGVATEDPYVGLFRPEDTFGAVNLGGNTFPLTTLAAFNASGLTATQLNGTWKLYIVDFKSEGTSPTPQSVDSWSLKLTSDVQPGFGADQRIATTVKAGPEFYSNPVTSPVNLSPTAGLTPGFSAAFDTSLGPTSPNRGQFYVAYTGVITDTSGNVTDTNINLLHGQLGGLLQSTRVNDDSANDNFTEGNRPQFDPAVTVDATTGTVVATWYDARFDAAHQRAATYIATSIDGGSTFSPQGLTAFLNRPKQAIDANEYAFDSTTNKSVSTRTIEPIPTNVPQSSPFGLGVHQSVYASAGHIWAFWAGNDDAVGSSLYRGTATTAVGPRILSGDMGPVANNVLTGFNITFDRPVDPVSFTPADVTVLYRSPYTPLSSPATDISNQVASVTTGNGINFFVRFRTPQTAIGTYSYAIGPNIRDLVRTATTTITPVAAAPPYNAPFSSTDVPKTISQAVDFGTPTTTVSTLTIATPLPPGQVIAALRLNVNITKNFLEDLRLTLIAPNGTRILLYDQDITGFDMNVTFDDSALNAISGQSGSPLTGSFRPDQPLSNLRGLPADGTWTLEIVHNFPGDPGTLNNWSLSIDPGVVSSAVVTGNLMDQDADAIAGEINGNDQFAIPYSKNGIPFSGNYDLTNTLPLIITGPKLAASQADPANNVTLNGPVSSINVTFDRPMNVTIGDPNSFGPEDILRITGPTGVVYDRTDALAKGLPFPGTVTPVAGTNGTTFRVTFPVQVMSGQYSIEVGSGIASAAGDLLDTNQNAGVSILRGGDPRTGVFSSNTYPSGAQPPVPIVASSSVEMPITINDDFTINGSAAQRVKVKLDISYPNDADLIADLVAPDGATIRLFTNLPSPPTGRHDNFTNTLFDDTASTPIQQAVPPYLNGPFTAQFPLSALIGHQSKGTWILRITSTASRGSSNTGTINSWALTLPFAVPDTGLGEPTGDRFTVGFRIFTQDPTNPLTQQVWTPVGPASENNGGNAGRINGLAVDPSDVSGNTMYLGAASGGIWKTTNFLTTSGNGPTWIPLTDFGPSFSLDTVSIAVLGRNADPSKSIVFALTGEGDTGSPGVGVLRSMDGGKTWSVLDSTTNSDAAGNILPIDSPQRDRIFFGATGFKIIVDPTPGPTGEAIVYMAIGGGGAAGGVWRSIDSGRHWVRIRAGDATDIVLAAGSPSGSTGNLQVLYAAFRGDGVYFTQAATSTLSMNTMLGGKGNPLFQDADSPTSAVIPIVSGSTPNGAKGRIVLTAPAPSGDPLKDRLYQGWLYAVVAAPNGHLDGVYMTKDFGDNWVKVRIPHYETGSPPTTAYGSNNESHEDHDPFGEAPPSPMPAQGWYDIAIAIDPLNPNVIYIGGTDADGPKHPLGGFLRVDVTDISDSQSVIAYNDSNNDGGTIQLTTNNGDINVKPPRFAGDGRDGPGNPYGPAFPNDYMDFNPDGSPKYVRQADGSLFLDANGNPVPDVVSGYFNLYRDPGAPFLSNSTIQFRNVAQINNAGTEVKISHFSAEVSTDVHRIITYVDPLTRQTRVVVGDDQGVGSSVDDGTGGNRFNIGFARLPGQIRNGNLQVVQFYYGASQPSQLAADIASAMFYGMAQDDGFPVAGNDILRNGAINAWGGSTGDGAGVATDQTGSGTSYQYRWPCCGAGPTQSDFFLVNTPGSGMVSRVNRLLQPGDNPSQGQGEWPLLGGATFTVNPIDGNAILMSAPGPGPGRVFETTDQGRTWFIIGGDAAAGTSPLAGAYMPALAFGAPDPNNPSAGRNSFIYAGSGSRIFVSFAGGGSSWTEISTGISGSVQQIVTDPTPGSRDAYAVTNSGVFFLADARIGVWKNITGSGTANLFALHKPIFGDANSNALASGSGEPLALRYLTTIAADWRYRIPINPADPTQGTFPILYVGGEGGVFRSIDQGATWTFFPVGSRYVDPASGQTFDLPDGGFLPDAHVTDLDLSLGNIDPNTGLPVQQTGGLNLLIASTYGRGTWAIRLENPASVAQFAVPLTTSGPRVAGVSAGADDSSILVRFDGPVNPDTFTKGDITLRDANGNVVTVTSVSSSPDIDPNPAHLGIDLRDTFRVRFTPTASATGFYDLTIGPDISDFAGYLMNQNQDFVNGDMTPDPANGGAPTDAYHGSVFFATPTATAGSLFIDMPYRTTAGDPVAVTVSAVDTAGHIMTGYTGTVHFTTNDGKISIGSGLPTDYTFTPGDAGKHVFTVVFKTAQVTTLGVTGTVGIGAAQRDITVKAGLAKSLNVSGFTPNPIDAGATGSFTVTALDAFQNVADGYLGTVHFTSTDPTAVAGTGLPDDYTFTATDASVHTFDTAATFKKAGVQTLTATDTVDPSIAGAETDIVVLPGPAVAFVVGGIPSPIVAGTPADFTVTAMDKYGNVASGYTGIVHFTSTDTQAGLPSDYGFSAGDAGTHTFTGGVTLKTAGTRSVTATDTVTTALTASQTGIIVVPGVTSIFTITGFSPNPVIAGTSASFTVNSTDAYGNKTTGYTGTIHFTSNDPLVSGGNGLPLDYKFTVGDNGAHRFTNGATLKTAGANQSITVTDTLTPSQTGTLNGIVVKAAAATSISVNGINSPIVAGTVEDMTVTVRDRFGNPADSYTGTVHFTSTDAKAGLPADYKFTAGDAGIHTFTGGVILKTAGNNQSVTATDRTTATITGAQTGIIVTAGPTSQFVISGFTPNPIAVGAPGTFTVFTGDVFGNPTTGYTGTIHFTSTDPNATLPADYTFTLADNSSHTFAGGATFLTNRDQTLTVTDTLDPTFTGSLGNIVVQAPLTVTADDKTKVYGSPIPALTYTVSGLVNGDTASSVLAGNLSVLASAGSPVGNYQIRQGSLILTSQNYALTFNAGTLSVTPAPLTISADDTTKVYGAGLPPLTYTAIGLVNGDTPSGVITGLLATSATAASPVGDYTITRGNVAANANYAVTFQSGTLSVTPAPLTVTGGHILKLYGAAIPPLTYTINGLVNGDTGAVVSGTAATPATAASVVGDYAITQGSVTANANYTMTFNAGTLTVTPAPLTVTANHITKIYGGAVPALTYAISGLVNGDTGAVVSGTPVSSVTAASPAGDYAITQGSVKTNTNYALNFVPGTLSVTPATLTVTANNATKVYGAAVPSFSFVITGGLVNGDTAAIVSGSPTTAATVASPVGDYPITQGSVKANANYAIKFVVGTLAVTPAPLTIVLNNATRVFNTPNPAFSVASYQGLLLGDKPAVVSNLNLTTPATIDSVVGQYPIVAANPPTAKNYAIQIAPGVLTITHARADEIVAIPSSLALGSGSGSSPLVNEYTLGGPEGLFRPTVSPFDPSVLSPGFTGGVRTAAADFNGDGVSDIVVGTGPGISTLVLVLDGKTRQELFRIQPFEAAFTGGVFVATGDMNGDGVPDLVITPDEGGGPRARAFDGNGFGQIADFLGINDPNFRGGARAAIGDVNHDGFGDLIVAAGFGGGPRVSTWDGHGLVAGQQTNLFPDFFIFGGSDAQTLRNGAFIAAGDINGDGYADLVAGGGPGGGPRVLAVDGKSLMQNGSDNPTPLMNFFAGDANNRGGIRVTVKDIDHDGKADVVVGAGDNAGSRVTAYRGSDLISTSTPPEAFSFDAFDSVQNGVYVG